MDYVVGADCDDVGVDIDGDVVDDVGDDDIEYGDDGDDVLMLFLVMAMLMVIDD